MVAKVVSIDVHSTVVFFKLDRGYSFLEGKIAKIIALIEMTAHIWKSWWSIGLDTILLPGRPGFNSPERIL